MPYGLDHETLLQRSTKRRRLLFTSEMARSDHEETPGYTMPEFDSSSSGMCDDTVTLEDDPRHTQQEIRTSDREELIECIKRGQKPTWVPKPALKALCAEEDALVKMNKSLLDQHTPPRPESSPVYQMQEEPFFGSWTDLPKPQAQWASHLENFAVGERADSNSFSRANTDPFLDGPITIQGRSPPWLESSRHTVANHRTPDTVPARDFSLASAHRRRAPSLGSSISSSFVMRTPTSPLVHAVSNPGVEYPTDESLPPDLTGSEKLMRRRTMPPNSYQSSRLSLTDVVTPGFDQTLAHGGLRREVTMPCYTHHPRRSLSSFTYQSSNNSPQTPYLRARRLSVASDSSPKQRTSMVGSFEESILRGRMSSPASKPFDFVAQIGVMGKGNCPSSLKCPAHVTVSFQAVFYSYPTSNYARTIADDAPSPYVGTIDLEHGLKPIHLTAKRKHNVAKDEASLSNLGSPAPEDARTDRALDRGLWHSKRRSSSPKMALGGAYRVPQKGQLQIIVKNPNKTAVKLFLVPYDLEGMEAGTKTFIRQRSYSSGVIVESALGNAKAEPTSVHDPLKDKDILRYLIHLKFCCPAKGRYYLHDSIRVVFANRVPDGKEKLRNELQLPEPRYSTYRPLKTVQNSVRSSFADFFSPDPRQDLSCDTPDEASYMKLSPAAVIPEELPDLTDTLPFHNGPRLGHNPARLSQEVFVGGTKSTHNAHLPSAPPVSPNPEQALSPIQGFLPSTSTRSSPVPWGSSSTSSTNRSFSPVPVEAGDGLLSRQFRNLTDTSTDP